jgi:hypothetical protein
VVIPGTRIDVQVEVLGAGSLESASHGDEDGEIIFGIKPLKSSRDY